MSGRVRLGLRTTAGGLRAPLLAHLAQQARQAAWLEARVRQHTLALAALPKWSTSATQSVSPLALLVPQLRKVAAVIPANVWLTGLNYDAPYWLLMGKGWDGRPWRRLSGRWRSGNGWH
ncbi:hypothetical protein NMD87_01145 [Edwardsiella tarda]|uniref:hypothetical protein n=1 Tax=Edwardsiella tarda TaxID=636 RepID=UPI00351C312A